MTLTSQQPPRQIAVVPAPTVMGGTLDDPRAVPHLWLAERLSVVTPDWEFLEGDEGKRSGSCPVGKSPLWRAE
jgi:hypothetical protein